LTSDDRKRVLTGLRVGPSNGEIWIAVNNILLHFDRAIRVTMKKHFSVIVGYQLGPRLVVDNNNSSKRIGLRLTQQGAVG
jgi:hypothetical protein